MKTGGRRVVTSNYIPAIWSVRVLWPGDTVHTFTRTLVEGLFGYQPDYPFGKVLVAPRFPADWTRAAITTPAVAMRFHREGGTSRLSARLQRAASIEVDLVDIASKGGNCLLNIGPTKEGEIPGPSIQRLKDVGIP